MTTNAVSAYFKFANLQMAAEATKLDRYLTGAIDLKGALTFGNNHSSKFTDVLAEQFVNDWKVVTHQPDTSTGFSGTLFECLVDDPARGLVKGEQVISFRSTEFADDAARDNEATNVLEVKEFGWGFGQIDDMKKWVDSLYASGKIAPTSSLNVTGYSLGGHLATAFNLLYPGAAQGTYTFNGAGVGAVTSGSLTQVIAQFDRQRMNVGGNEITFTDPQATIFYRQMHAKLTGGVAPNQTDIENAGLLVGNVEEARLPKTALERIKAITDEVTRLQSITNTGLGVTQVPASSIDATKLDYQLAALIAGRSTSGVRTNVAVGGWDAYAGRNPAPGGALANFYDIYGANAPSAVSNSQRHYGIATPIFIENQPLFRGSILLDAVVATVSNAEAKLLVNGFRNNDFGDTHSLVLLVDSLSVQNALAQLDPQASPGTLNAILKSASNATTSLGGQGKAEGDVLESVVDALYRMFLDPKANDTDTTKQMIGGAWADIDARNAFYNRLDEIFKSDGYKTIKAGVPVDIKLSGKSLAGRARDDFGAFAALLTLSPFSINAKNSGSQAALASALGGGPWSATYIAWQADKAMTQADRDAGKATYTDRWFADRAAMIDWLVLRNDKNIPNGVITGGLSGRTITQSVNYQDFARNTQLLVGTAASDRCIQIVFGDDAANNIIGYGKADHLYGGAGDDTLNGWGGADYLEGNAGADQLFGGLGADTINGGTGADFICGSGEGIDCGFVDPAPVPTGAAVLARGDGWATYQDANGLGLCGPSATPLFGNAINLINGGAGDDHIDAGTGNDLLLGDDGTRGDRKPNTIGFVALGPAFSAFGHASNRCAFRQGRAA